MRSDKEMLELIINIADRDERVRAVYMNGSGTNVNAPEDILRDYDIVYIVTETKSFYEDENWIKNFGEVLYMQCPERNDSLIGMDYNLDESFGWLVIFEDYNRLDIHVETLSHFRDSGFINDSLTKVLLDKDGLLTDVPVPSDRDYWVKKPTNEEFRVCCNEFWWCLNNVAKGLWRYEIPYAQDMLNMYVRQELVKMLSWKVGIMTDFSVSVGKSGKYLNRWLSYEEWERFLETYSSGIAGEMWRAVNVMCDLFDDVASEVAGELGYDYDWKESDNARHYLQFVRGL